MAAVISLIAALILTPLVRRLAIRLDVVAHPGGRRVHTRTTPLMGGIAMYVGFILAVVITVVVSRRLVFDMQTIGILVGATYVAIVGVIDDRYELPGWFQAASIVISGVILVMFGVRVQHITNPFQGGQLMWLGWLGIPLTLVWVLMVTKAVDCMDGLDGLAAGIATIASATLMLMAIRSGQRFEMSAVMAAALLGGTLGFLRYNYPPAKIFMGTVGAQFLGFMLAGISIAGAFKIAAFVAVVAPVMVLGVPLFDTAFVVLRRIATGKKIHEADTSHLHHRLVDKGFSHRQVVWFIYALTMILCAAAYLLFTYSLSRG